MNDSQNDSNRAIRVEYNRISTSIDAAERTLSSYEGEQDPSRISRGEFANLARQFYQAQSDLLRLQGRQQDLEAHMRSQRTPFFGRSRNNITPGQIAELRVPINGLLDTVANTARGFGFNGDVVLERGRQMAGIPAIDRTPAGGQRPSISTLPRFSADHLRVPSYSSTRRRSSSLGHGARPSISEVAGAYFAPPGYRPASSASNYQRPASSTSNYRPASSASNYATPLSRPASSTSHTSFYREITDEVRRRLANLDIHPIRDLRHQSSRSTHQNVQSAAPSNATRHNRTGESVNRHIARIRGARQRIDPSSQSHQPSTSRNYSSSTTTRAHRPPTPAEQQFQDLNQNQGAGSSTSRNYSSSTTARAHRPPTPAEQRFQDLNQNQSAGSSHTRYYYSGPKP
jgi:hypothetical protein